MRCATCGQLLPADASNCPNCGASAMTVTGTVPLVPGTDGVPVSRFTPGTYGPPTGRDPFASSRISYPPERRVGYRPVVLPPSEPQPVRKRPTKRIVLACVLLVLLAVSSVTLLTGRVGLPSLPSFQLPGSLQHLFGTAQQPATSADAALCAAAAPDASVASTLTHVQFTSQLRDTSTDDYRPTDALSTLHASEMAYLTFRIDTADAGSVLAVFCLPESQMTGSLAVPAQSTGKYAYFALHVPSGVTGAGSVILDWSGKTASILTYYIAT